MNSNTVRVGIIGAGNCASSFVQGLTYYKDAVPDEDKELLGELRTALNAGQLGQEGFMTSLRLGGHVMEELKKIVFAPPPADD